MENLELIREQIMSHLSDDYRTIWIQRHARSGQRDILITLFPHGFGQYRIVTLRNLSEITFEEIFSRLQRELSVVDINI
jgi:hypothetical protein